MAPRGQGAVAAPTSGGFNISARNRQSQKQREKDRNRETTRDSFSGRETDCEKKTETDRNKERDISRQVDRERIGHLSARLSAVRRAERRATPLTKRRAVQRMTQTVS